MDYFPQQKEKTLEKYKDRVSISSYNVSNYHILSLFDELNHDKPFSKIIKSFNFFTIGTKYRKDSETNEPVISCLPKVSENEYDTLQYMPFVDYRSGKKYPNKSSMDTKFYWKPLSVVLEEFLDHDEVKSEGDTGLLQRKHLEIDKSMIRYIGKETNKLEESFVLGVSKTNEMEYVNSQERLREIIESLTLETALENGISRRTFFYLKKKLENNEQIKLKEKILKKLQKIQSF